MGMLESRLRVKTNNTLKVQLSPQDVVSCSQLSQGCDGGFPFLVAGKYAMVSTLNDVQKNHYSSATLRASSIPFHAVQYTEINVSKEPADSIFIHLS
jgi:hypothetical protein